MNTYYSNIQPVGISVSGSQSKLLLFVGAAIIIYLISKK